MNVFLQFLINILEKNPNLIVEVIKILADIITKNPAIVADVVKAFQKPS